MESFNHFLREKQVSNELRSLLYHMARSVKYINFSIRAGNTGKNNSQNSFGESQAAMDVLSDQIIAEELKKSELTAIAISEEKPEPQRFLSPRGDYLVAYDPLDGSSLVDTNGAIGTIFGIWENSSSVLNSQGKTHMVGACYAVYGPRVTFVIAVKDKGVHEFELNDVGEFILIKENLLIAPSSNHFSPGNSRAYKENKMFQKWFDQCLSEQRTLRYGGAMVSDLNHLLMKGHGIFCNCSGSQYPEGKLRYLFECAPFGFIFEEADGAAIDQNGKNILDIEIADYHQKTSIVIGSKEEVSKMFHFAKSE